MYKVLIRPLEITDAEISWRWRNNPIIWELTGSKPSREITFEIERNWIEKVIQDETSRRFAILVDDVYVGNIQLTNIVKNEFAEYHIFIGETEYWNKGIARLASLQIIRYAKNVLQLKKIVLQVNPNNSKAIKLYQSINFIITSDEIKMELNLEQSPEPLVSVLVMVYNHEKYIDQAIDEILKQKSNFDFEIVVGEDFSTDNSRKILIQHQNKYPGKFKLLLHDKNIGAQNNQIEVLKECKGKYIAICEGDDYWTDPLKLQKQVDFLEKNNDYSICWTKYLVKNESSAIATLHEPEWVHQVERDKDLSFDLTTIFNPYCTLTLTAMFRKTGFDFEILKRLNHAKDNTIYALCLTYGRGMLLNFNAAVYRVHGGGTYSNASEFKQRYYSYLNIKEIVDEISGCDTPNLIQLRNNLLRISIRTCPNQFSKQYLNLLFEAVHKIGIKNTLILAFKKIIIWR